MVTGNTIQYQRKKLVPWNFAIPIISVSIPAAFFAGTLTISESLFVMILGISLLFSGLAMIIRHSEVNEPKEWILSRRGLLMNAIIGVILGLIAGFVGIGGGILFAPLLHLQKCLPSKQIAAFASVFIFFNSIAGLSGQLTKQTSIIKYNASDRLYLALLSCFAWRSNRKSPRLTITPWNTHSPINWGAGNICWYKDVINFFQLGFYASNN